MLHSLLPKNLFFKNDKLKKKKERDEKQRNQFYVKGFKKMMHICVHVHG